MRFDEWYPPYMKRGVGQRECECVMFLGSYLLLIIWLVVLFDVSISSVKQLLFAM